MFSFHAFLLLCGALIKKKRFQNKSHKTKISGHPTLHFTWWHWVHLFWDNFSLIIDHELKKRTCIFPGKLFLIPGNNQNHDRHASLTIIAFHWLQREMFYLHLSTAASVEEVRPDALPWLQDGETKHDPAFFPLHVEVCDHVRSIPSQDGVSVGVDVHAREWKRQFRSSMNARYLWAVLWFTEVTGSALLHGLF